MIDRYYLARHAAGLLKLAQATADADFAATLIAKAADLQARIDESGYPDVTPRAPDVERPRLTVTKGTRPFPAVVRIDPRWSRGRE